MMADKPRFYITTAIAYPNGPPHIGHGYEVIATDAIARFKRLDGYDVFFLTGTDEHGIKMRQTANREGITPRQLVDRNVPRFQDMAKRLNARTTRSSAPPKNATTNPRRRSGSACRTRATSICRSMPAGTRCGRGLLRRERDQARPRAARASVHSARRSSGSRRRAISSVSRPIADRLLELYAEQPDFVLPKERLNEVASFVKGGLQDLSISRTTFDWGVQVPGDPKHVMYVWVDALTNYITAVGYP